MVMNSNRRYQNIRLCFPYGCYFTHKIQKYVLSFSSKLVELEIKYFHSASVENEQFPGVMDLSGLKVLKLQRTSLKLTSKLLDRCHSLTELVLRRMLDYFFAPQDLRTSLRKFFRQNEKLEHLEMNGNAYKYFSVFLEEAVPEIVNFKLKGLKLLTGLVSASASFYEETEQNLLKFLAKHSQSLESVQISVGRCKVKSKRLTQKTCNSIGMKILSSLAFQVT